MFDDTELNINLGTFDGSANRKAASRASPTESSQISSINSRKGIHSPNLVQAAHRKAQQNQGSKLIKGFSAIESGFSLNENEFNEKEKLFRDKLGNK